MMLCGVHRQWCRVDRGGCVVRCVLWNSNAAQLKLVLRSRFKLRQMLAFLSRPSVVVVVALAMVLVKVADDDARVAREEGQHVALR